MTFTRAFACPGCGAHEPAEAFAPLDLRCACGQRRTLSLPLAAELRTPTGGRALVTDRRWRDALRARAAGGPFVLDACPGCGGPLTLPQQTPLRLDCRYCHETSEVPLVEHAVDLLPMLRLSARTWGGGMDLRWIPEVRHGALAEPCCCPHCGAPIEPFVGSAACEHCDGALFAFTACGHRFLPGVRVEGDDEGRALGDWLPLTLALEHYEQRSELAAGSQRSTCAFLGVWLALFPLGCLLALSFPFVGGYVMERFGPVGAFVTLFAYAALAALPFCGGILFLVLRHRRRRAALVGG
ncbi:MAG: hypothetical protein KDD82_14435 [Planctomycetes bacterium]|nr:hypothetical protein [Planctomycetota bacterium]